MIGSTSWVVRGTYFENASILENLVDVVELLIYTWDKETKKLITKEADKLLSLNLKYSVHLPTDNVLNAKNALAFFEQIRFPLINAVLHPMKGWKEISWSEIVAVENLTDKVECHNRMVFDIGHQFLGLPFPENSIKNIVEIHAMGVENGKDHLPLNNKGLEILKNIYKKDIPIIFEVFDLKGLKQSLQLWEKEIAKCV